MVALGGDVQYFKVKERTRRDVVLSSRRREDLSFDNFRRYPGRHCGAIGFIGFGNEWCMAIK